MDRIGKILVAVVVVFGFLPAGARAGEAPTLAPLNPGFRGGAAPSKTSVLVSVAGVQQDFALGYIPSPVPPEKHVPMMRAAAAVTDPKYDMRDPNNDGNKVDSLLTPVRNQGTCGACWTFGTYGALESHLKKYFAQVQDLSEDNLKHLHGFDSAPCDGGNVEMSTAYLSRYTGAISEGDDPYDQSPSSVYCTDCDPIRFVDNVIFLPVRASTTDNTYIKEAVLSHGGLYTSLYYDPACFNSSTDTYYYDDPNDSFDDSNHTVVIVGWNDNKYVSGAPEGKRNGAFIARNSWGSSWGDGGYFYVSYHDEGIAFTTLAYFDERAESAFSFETVYYYDELGRTSSMGYGNKVAWGANWFVPVRDDSLKAVGFYASDSPTQYEIYIYEQFNGASFSDLKATKTGSVPHPGWYTVELDEPVALQEGDGFGVVIKFTNYDYNFPVPLETNIFGYSWAASANPGESYVSSNGSTWTDVTSYTGWQEYNVCIKAFCGDPGEVTPAGPCADPGS